MKINAKGIHYRDLNEKIRKAISEREKKIILENVNGQRYIGTGIKKDIDIKIHGIPGNDLAAFMDGPSVEVFANGQDAIGNTMNSGKVVVHGSVGDTVGYSMRGGKIFIRGDAGYRVGIHMKSYKESYPVVIIGGHAGDFLGEYMAGGLMIVLGLDKKEDMKSNYIGTGMHGGTIYIRGKLKDYQLGKEVKAIKVDNEDKRILGRYLEEYCNIFKLDLKKVLSQDFVKLIPYSHRPYGRIYAY